jgi:hypothetical protein
MEITEIKVGMKFTDKDRRRPGRVIVVKDTAVMALHGQLGCLVQTVSEGTTKAKLYTVPSHRLVNPSRFTLSVVPGELAPSPLPEPAVPA